MPYTLYWYVDDNDEAFGPYPDALHFPTAGKDRTGMFATILQLVRDYLLDINESVFYTGYSFSA